MKLRKILLILASILFLATDIINMIVNSNYSFYNIGSLIIVYIPFVILICFTENILGKIIAIGFCIIDLLGIIITSVSLIWGTVDLSRSGAINIIITDYGIASVMRVLIIISIVQFLKDKSSKWINISIVSLYVLFIASNIIIIFNKRYGNDELLPILKMCSLYLLIIAYLIKISLDREEFYVEEHLLEKDNSL